MLLHVGEICSLIPPHVSVLALTATISCSSREEVQSLLGMKSPRVITMSPSKDNIKYSIEKFSTLDEVFTPLGKKLQSLRSSIGRYYHFLPNTK
uniref:Helicase ATP-binding domain-containing protein n=1 Tax=Amphimedon queenslandica TaxID=400682 RepID=A0A1X7V2R8_AMPQE